MWDYEAEAFVVTDIIGNWAPPALAGPEVAQPHDAELWMLWGAMHNLRSTLQEAGVMREAEIGPTLLPGTLELVGTTGAGEFVEEGQYWSLFHNNFGNSGHLTFAVEEGKTYRIVFQVLPDSPDVARLYTNSINTGGTGNFAQGEVHTREFVAGGTVASLGARAAGGTSDTVYLRVFAMNEVLS
ncbi:hypothetical protein HUK65_01785 [Rhodobacteraceae bacterium 2376]|uniref:Uncharacterized protein n=2 Tax=Rhabdonatronobacter sediminivivens TaxID=2743469 RepID=A0A7Z0KXJ9_9RHOB|nr:hypothetical protein [Rhabdonatronobacter sediminivivens]